MSYFLYPSTLQTAETVILTVEEAKHLLLSRRIKVGEVIELQDINYKRFEAEVTEIKKQEVQVKILRSIPVPEESPLTLTLHQALIAEQALDVVLQKATELGVSSIVVFQAENSPHSVEKQIEKKLNRWQKITQEAAKQCGRTHVPGLHFQKNLTSCFMEQQPANKLCFDTSGITFQEYRKKYENNPPTNIGICIGPEGGWTKNELQLLRKNNIPIIKLGPRILRAETASLAAISLVQHLYGDM